MKEKIQELIQQHKERNQEVWEEFNELSKIDVTKLSDEDENTLEKTILVLKFEYGLRNSVICELQDLL